MKSIITAAALLASLSACTSHAIMRDGRGVDVDCRYTAIGPFSAMVGSAAQDACVEKYRALGFQKQSSAVPEAAENPSAGTASNNTSYGRMPTGAALTTATMSSVRR